jgi:glutamate dehydrogenase
MDASPPTDVRDQVVDDALDLGARRPGAPASYATAFLPAYLGGLPRADVAGREPVELEAAAWHHFTLARQRTAGSPLVAVYQPTEREHGWSGARTIVDVVVDDGPFVVSTLLNVVEARDLTVHLLNHPVLTVARSESGYEVQGLARPGVAATAREAFVHLEVDRVPEAQRHGLRDALNAALGTLRAVVDDFADMVAATRAAADATERAPGVDPAIAAEGAALLRWMVDGHFVFLAIEDDQVSGDGVGDGGVALVADQESARGLWRARGAVATDVSVRGPAAVAAAIGGSRPVVVSKTVAESPVHRRARMDHVAVKVYDANGRVTGERRILGLWSARAYAENVGDIPVLRTRVAAILRRVTPLEGSHDASRLLAIFERYPRDDLFAFDVDTLEAHGRAILQLHDRPLVRLLARRDDFGRWWSCLVFVPRDRFDTSARLRIQELLVEAFGGQRCTFTTQIDESALARVQVTVFTPDGAPEHVDVAAVEQRVGRLVRSWSDDLERALVEWLGEVAGVERARRWDPVFPPDYRLAVTGGEAVDDLLALERLAEPGTAVALTRPADSGIEQWRLRLYRAGGPVQLSDVLPLLHDLGARVTDERPYELDTPMGRRWIYDVGLRIDAAIAPHDLDGSSAARRRFEETFLAAFRGDTESDGLNRLALTAGLDWSEIVVLRAYRRYLHQTGVRYEQSLVEETMLAHSPLVASMMAQFRCRFDPDGRDDDRAAALDLEVIAGLDAITTLDADRILRGVRSLVQATVRTNRYRLDAEGRPPRVLAFKLDPALVAELPAPRPKHEIFVYSPDFEGVHLRMGLVARGGIRWSDRRDDFRTEILGLMKAQNVKNAVIVPVGAKGGFVLRRPPVDPAAFRAFGRACYEQYIDALLSITDDRRGDDVVPPPGVVRHDGDDPYLVVAADKGTATFSDVANARSMEAGFWLGDAFASGGSTGYDHKAMGITARGAWVSVERHFRQLGVDPLADIVRVVGVGDMSGDVFGNGTLRPNLKLLAAFDHRHVFIDPDPDPATSFAERRRLFTLPGSSWADYDASLISEGGGVFARSVKSVPLSKQAQAALGVAADSLTPAELVKAILCAPVDLLFNGGIGTFVKASTEAHADVGDRGNDALRVDGRDLRCRVVGEGGNLGFTQLGRIEYAAAGGRIFTDFIDNSAGVDTSDHEVNLKILLDRVVAAGDLTTKQRNELLASMTDEVAEQVLDDNFQQALALSLAIVQSPPMLEVHRRQIQWLEQHGSLDRFIEFLPSEDGLSARRADGRGLTSPELAVLLSYTKNAMVKQVMRTSLPDEAAYQNVLHGYFPGAVRERFPAAIAAHPLRRELVATGVVNAVVNRAGPTMAVRLADETSAPLDEILRAHTVSWRIFGLEPSWQASVELTTVPGEVRTQMLLDLRRLGERGARWLLRSCPHPIDIEATAERLALAVRDVLEALPAALADLPDAGASAGADDLVAAGVPAPLAVRVAATPVADLALDLVDVMERSGRTAADAVAVYVALDRALGLTWLREAILSLSRADRWASRARSALRDDFHRTHADLTVEVLATAAVEGVSDAGALVEAWQAGGAAAVERAHALAVDLRSVPALGVDHLSVALRELRNLVNRSRASAG